MAYRYNVTGNYKWLSMSSVYRWLAKKRIAEHTNPDIARYSYYNGVAQGSIFISFTKHLSQHYRANVESQFQDSYRRWWWNKIDYFSLEDPLRWLKLSAWCGIIRNLKESWDPSRRRVNNALKFLWETLPNTSGLLLRELRLIGAAAK